ncbi:DUF5686 family protein [Thermophagus sp. OGC60D27]|uniref:DUF5686 family protein n=1 Tax=Thermophagus sp. OGC60D27 TaxID=3458415 RepID=UPI0040379B84
MRIISVIQLEESQDKKTAEYFLRLLTAFWILFGSNVFGQTTVVKGWVYDEVTRAPLPLVNISFKGTTIGTASDTLGFFSLTADVWVDTVVFSSLGYVTRRYGVKQGGVQNLEVRMHPTQISLEEIEVTPDDGPIRRVMKGLAAHKGKNNPAGLERYSYRRYTKWDYRINNISDKMTQWNIFKPARGVFGYDGQVRYLPVYFSEQVVFNEFQKAPPKRKSTIEADHTIGLGMLEETEISGFTSGLDDGLNFYENTLPFLGQQFISPAHDNGWFYYNYYLLDSVKTDQGTEYKIRFTPRRKGDNTFRGEMSVLGSHFAIRNIEAQLINTEHLNFIRELKISTDYQLVGDTIPFYGSSEIAFTIDYLPIELKKNQQGVELKAVNYMHFSDVNIAPNENVVLSHRQLSYESLKAGDYNKKDSVYWQMMRPVALDSSDLDFKAGIDSVNRLPVVRLLDNVANMAMTGYYDFGRFEWGPFDETILFNEVEGTHLYVGGRTSDEWSDRFSLWGGVGYGTRNEQWLGRLGAGVLLPTMRRNLISVEYNNNMVLIGENENILYLYENKQSPSTSNLISYLFLRDELDELHQVKKLTASFDHEVRTGFSIKTSASALRYYSPEFYPFLSDGAPLDHFDASEIRVKLRRSWMEKYLDYGYRRIYLSSPKPVINMVFSGGMSNVDDERGLYGKIHTSFKHHYYLGQARLSYALEGGWIFGRVPYPLLEIPRGNESYGISRYRFNMMNNLAFFHDRYLHVFTECNLNGFWFKRLPFLNRLGLREVISAKAMLGSVENRHRGLLEFPETFSDYNNKPYVEAGVGVENVLRFFRFDAIWRLTETEEAPKFGVRASFEIKI